MGMHPLTVQVTKPSEHTMDLYLPHKLGDERHVVVARVVKDPAHVWALMTWLGKANRDSKYKFCPN